MSLIGNGFDFAFFSFGNLTISKNASITGNMVVGGTLTAQEIHTEIESASIIFTSGSTLFGNTQDDIHTFTGSLKITGSVTALNLTADSSSFSTRVTNLKSDSGSFSTRVTDLKSDSGSFSTRVTDLKSDSGSFSTKITNFSTGNVELISGSATSTGSFGHISTDTITSFTINGSPTFTGDSTGFGIGINDPGFGLDVASSGRFTGVLYLGQANTADGTIVLYNNTGTATFTIQNEDGNGVFQASSDSNRTLTFKNTGAGDKLSVLVEGDVSGSSTSTGSFGRVEVVGSGSITGDLNVGNRIRPSGDIIPTSDNAVRLGVPAGFGAFSEIHGYQLNLTGGTLTGENGGDIHIKGNGSSNYQLFVSRAGGGGGVGIYTNTPRSNTFHVAASGGIFSENNISGSATSTGSFGRVQATNAEFTSGNGLTLTNSSQFNMIRFKDSTDRAHLGFSGGSDNNFNIWNIENGSQQFATNNTLRMTIAAGGDVGIGNTTSDSFYNSKLVVGAGSGEENLTLYAGSGANSGLFFADATSGNGRFSGQIYYNHSTDKMQFATGYTGASSYVLELDGNKISGSATSTGSFGRVEADSGSFDVLDTSGKITSAGGVTVTGTSKLQAFRTSGQFIEIYPDGNGSNYLQAQGNIRFAPNLGTKMILHANGRLGINTTTDAGFQMDVNGTGRFSDTLQGTHFSGSQFTGIFNGALSGSAQIASNISGAFAVASASFAADILSNSSSFAARDTLSEATSSKILNGELEFTNITGSGHVSMSLSSTGSFGRVSATTIGGHSPLIVDSKTTFTNSITSSAHVSSSMASTASFGRVNVIALGGHQALTIDPITTFTNVITASSAVQFDGKIFIETGSIEGDLHVRTNENLMRIGKSTSGLIVSGSNPISRFATGSDGSIIDLGFTVVDEDGNVVLAGDGDGIHVDSNNYWYNNKYYKVGDGSRHFLQYDPQDGMRYKGEVVANTGSFAGEMFINSPTGSMFIGKFTGGIPSSGSGNISRFATGSDGSIIDLGFTTTDEEGETVFLTTGDGIFRDDRNYWYTTGHFKIGNADNFINWNTSNLTISGTFTGDGSGLTGISGSGGGSVPAGTVSSSAQLATAISGSFTSVSASLASRITTGGITLPTNTLSSSAQISTQISGSLGTNATFIRGLTEAGISGSTTVLSSSLASRIKSLEAGGVTVPTGTVSGSAQLATAISGSFTALSSSFASRLTTGGLTLPTNTISSSAQLAVSISGSFVQPSASFSTRVTSLEAGGGSVPTGTVSGSAQLASSISGSFVQSSASFSTRITNIVSSPITALNNATANELVTVGSTTTELDAETNLTFDGSNGKLNLSGFSYPNIRVVGTQLGYIMVGDTNATSNFQNYQLVSDGGNFEVRRVNDGVNSVLETPFKISSDKVEVLNISGSSTSTGSFGHLMVGGGNFTSASLAASGISNVVEDTTPQLGGDLDAQGNLIDDVGRIQADGTNYLFTTRTTTGGGNTSMGHDAGSNSNPTYTTNFGHQAGMNSTGGGNIAIGPFAMDAITSAYSNVAIGYEAATNISNTNSHENVFIGDSAGEKKNDGTALNFATKTVLIGAHLRVSGGTNEIILGHSAYGNGNNTATIGNKDVTDVYMNASGSAILHVGNVTGSATSTGSFGLLQGDGSELSNVTATLPSGVISGSSGNLTVTNTITATTGSISNIQTPLTGRVISNFTEMIKVTVVSDGGNHYAFEGATAPSIQVSEGKTYRFDISDSTVGSHPFRLSTTEDGQHNGGSAYTTGVTLVGTQGQAGAYLEIQITKGTANALYYYCTSHPGMGNDGRLLKNDLMNLAAIKVTGNQVDFTNLPTSDPSVAGRLWNDSGTVKISSG